jgi:CubicO group peptidase (beta-lactamase class C family)
VNRPRSAGEPACELADRAPAGLTAAGETIARLLATAIDDGFPAGATVIAADSHGPLLRHVGGWACLVGERVPTAPDTLYDIASLTKVVATVPLALALAERGALTLDDPVARWLPDFARGDTTLRALLTHTSGLPAHRPYFLRPGGADGVRRAVIAEGAQPLTPGPVCYSDLGYMLLGWALSAAGGAPLDRLFEELIAHPLGLAETGFRPAASLRQRTAATELDGDQRPEPGLVWGEVHDGNAWALGGVSGHAGLFAPADDLARFASALLSPARHPVLSPASVAEMMRGQAGEPPDVRALGWRLDASDWGPWPAATIWHTGFTGTSLLIAPEIDLAVVLLLGGVHPRRDGERLAEVRAAVHRALIAGALA